MVYIGATFTCNNYIVFSFSFKIYFYHLCKLNENKGHLSLRIPHPIQLSQIFSIFMKRDTLRDNFNFFFFIPATCHFSVINEMDGVQNKKRKSMIRVITIENIHGNNNIALNNDQKCQENTFNQR